MPGTYIHLPGGVHAVLKADQLATMFDINSDRTDLHFESPAGMKYVMDSFIAAADTVTGQINRRNISVADIKQALPQFRLDVNASGAVLSASSSRRRAYQWTLYGAISNVTRSFRATSTCTGSPHSVANRRPP